MSDLFPDNVVHEILTRLPSKSVCRFRVVSKRWSSIITAPRFLTTYISRHSPTWFILDRLVRCSGTDKETNPVRFDLSIHSSVVNLTVNPHLVLKPDEPVSGPVCTSVIAPAEIIHSSNGLILFAVNINPDPFKDGTAGFLNLPFKPKFDIQDGQPTMVFSRDPARDVFFVTNAVTREWARLPRPPQNFDKRYGVGFVTRPGPVGEFVLGGFHHDKYSSRCTLTCFGSETGKWVEKEADYPLGSRGWLPWCRFNFQGRMCWSDPSVGIIMWDEDPFVACLSQEKAVFRFIPLPVGCAREECSAEMLQLRCVDGVGDWIQYMEMFPNGTIAVKVWRLKDYNEDCEWELVYKLPRVAFEDYLDPECWTGNIAFAQPFDPDVAVIHGKDSIFSIDFRTRAVKSCSSFLGHVCAMPCVVPSWPPSLPRGLSADYIKEQGNAYFKRQNFSEAIKCYSRSIALSPNVAAAYANRGMAYLKLGRFREAEEDCTEALNLDETYFKVYGRRAIAREKLGNIEGALEDEAFALKLQAESAEMKKQCDELRCQFDESCIAEGESGDGGANCVIDMDGEQPAE